MLYAVSFNLFSFFLEQGISTTMKLKKNVSKMMNMSFLMSTWNSQYFSHNTTDGLLCEIFFHMFNFLLNVWQSTICL